MQAIEDCNKAIELDPGFVKAHFRKGKALLTLVREGKGKEVIYMIYTYILHTTYIYIREDNENDC